MVHIASRKLDKKSLLMQSFSKLFTLLMLKEMTSLLWMTKNFKNRWKVFYHKQIVVIDENRNRNTYRKTSGEGYERKPQGFRKSCKLVHSPLVGRDRKWKTFCIEKCNTKTTTVMGRMQKMLSDVMRAVAYLISTIKLKNYEKNKRSDPWHSFWATVGIEKLCGSRHPRLWIQSRNGRICTNGRKTERWKNQKVKTGAQKIFGVKTVGLCIPRYARVRMRTGQRSEHAP